MQCGGFSDINFWNSFAYIEIFNVIFAYYVKSDDRSCAMCQLIMRNVSIDHVAMCQLIMRSVTIAHTQ